MPAPASSQQPGSEHASGILWIIALVFVILAAVWYVFRSYIAYFYLTIKMYEINFLAYISTHLGIGEHYFDQLQLSIMYARMNPTSVSFNQLLQLGTEAGDVLRFIFIAILIVLAFVVYFGNTARIYKRTYNMKDLAKLERKNWPQITPVVGLDLLKKDIDEGAWAMALTPMQFCKRYKLLEEVRPQRREGMPRKDWDRIDVVLKRGEANKLFALQLGSLWRGANRLPPHVRALFAVFAARINADTDPAKKLLVQMSDTCNTKVDYTGVDELLKKHENTKIVQRIVQSHAYIYTVMASMLERARDDGVQASADFLWIKPIDRRLWYVLNTVGRQTPFPEVAGPYAHWIAEKEAGKKLLVPVVEEATNALELSLREILYIPDET